MTTEPEPNTEIDESAPDEYAPPPEDSADRFGVLTAALAGVTAAVAAIGFGEIIAAISVPRAAPLAAVGDVVIVNTPEALKRWAIETFGTADKFVLQLGTVVLLAVFAAGIGIAARRSTALGMAGIAVFTAIGVASAVTRPDGTIHSALPSLFGGALAGVLLWWFPRLVRGRAEADDPRGSGRRRFLFTASITIGAAGLGGFLARGFAAGAAVENAREEVRLPPPADPAPDLPENVELDVPDISDWTTPNAEFYRIDTALTVPRVAPEDYRLRIHGRVDNPMELTYADLLKRPLIERDITMCCVSNSVGGDLIGNARWLGVRLADLLVEAGPQPGADQLVGRSYDGWTAGSPTALCMDGRDAMLALGMNGEPLPVEHGFPVRMVVPGLYGYVSATKWLAELELTSFADFDAYWIPRGWSTPSPIKTQSRIDTPGRNVEAGTVPVAGVAWAQHRGIGAVEVRVDDGPWEEATLSDAASTDTWRQWVWEWDATPGDHSIAVRATDSDGETQTGEQSPVAPDGATGWHTVQVTVT